MSLRAAVTPATLRLISAEGKDTERAVYHTSNYPCRAETHLPLQSGSYIGIQENNEQRVTQSPG